MAVGIYAINTRDQKVVKLRKQVLDSVLAEEGVMQMHGFHVDFEKKKMRFDIVVSFDAGDRYAVYNRVIEKMKKEYPDYEFNIVLDTDFA